MSDQATSMHILAYILEDDKDVMEIIESLVIANDLTNVNMYTDPQQFLDELTANISVCVIDHRLSNGLTGLDIIAAVKARNKYSYVIIMTGQEDKRVVVKYLNAGADHYIDKDEGQYLKVLIEELRVGFKEAKDRIEFEHHMRARAKETAELISKLP